MGIGDNFKSSKNIQRQDKWHGINIYHSIPKQ